ncbi:MAG: DUF87 domain-containing protein [Lachnospiraceae bacterium]|nr:DUF87 domain-containing protein [Lachnospiraceae bacterium]
MGKPFHRFHKTKKPKKSMLSTSAQSIPYLQVYANGIIEVEAGVFSKSYRIPEMNFINASDKVQKRIVLAYSRFLSSFDESVTVQMTLFNRTIDIEEFQERVFFKMKPDGLNDYREELNNVILEKMTKAKNNLRTEKIMTVTLEANEIAQAVELFDQIDDSISMNMQMITESDAEPLTIYERLEILNSIYNPDSAKPLCEKRMIQGNEVESFSLENCIRQGITTKDVIAPASFDFKNDHIRIGNSYAKTFYISNYPSWIKGDILSDFASIPANLLVSVYFNTINPGKSLNLLKRQHSNIASNLVQIQKKAAGQYDFTLIEPDTQDARVEVDKLTQNLTKDDSKLFTVTFLFTLFAPDMETLHMYEEKLNYKASRNMLTIKPLIMQQETGFDSALPLGNKKVSIERLMDSYSIAPIVPFNMKEFNQRNGLYYGINATSRNMIFYDPTSQMNANSAIIGQPGSGKSVTAKLQLIQILLKTTDDVCVIDPNGEYLPLVKAFHGAYIKIANGSSSHINPFDLNLDNTDAETNSDPVKTKCDFIEALCEIMVGGQYGLSDIKKSIISRCALNIYEPYVEYLNEAGLKYDPEHNPTFSDFYNEVCIHSHPEAQDLALSLERFVDGSMDTFSHHTNINVNNRFIVYDTKDIGKGLKASGLHVCNDNIWNRMIANSKKGIRTWIFMDEFHEMFKTQTSADYTADFWKMARKFGGAPCGILQNIEELLKTTTARIIFNNCMQVIMLEQSSINLQQLTNMFDLSEEEQKYLNMSKSGYGLLRIGKDVIPVDLTFPTDTEVYHLITTKFGE